MVRNSLLFAPILEEGKTEREVYLPPENAWYELNFIDAMGNDNTFDLHQLVDSATEHKGDQVITVKAPIEQCPIFVKAGSIIPFRTGIDFSQVRITYDLYACDIDFLIFPDKHHKPGAKGMLYMDDGLTMNFETKDEYALFELLCEEHFKDIDNRNHVELTLISGNEHLFHPYAGQYGKPMALQTIQKKYFD